MEGSGGNGWAEQPTHGEAALSSSSHSTALPESVGAGGGIAHQLLGIVADPMAERATTPDHIALMNDRFAAAEAQLG